MVLDRFQLNGKVALVTGNARGLGQATSIGLAQAGADIVGVDIGDLGKTKELVEATGKKFLGIQANLLDIDNLQGIVDQIVDEFGHIDILVNNAGTIIRRPSIEYEVKDWDRVMNLNIRTLFFLSQCVAKQYIEQGTRGKIINMASMLSYQGGLTIPSYTASKSAVLGLTKALANEWAGQGINVNAIAPGYLKTELSKPLREDKERNAAILGRIPHGDWGEPEDLQGAMVFLASDASNYIDGFTIAIDGGWLAW